MALRLVAEQFQAGTPHTLYRASFTRDTVDAGKKARSEFAGYFDDLEEAKQYVREGRRTGGYGGVVEVFMNTGVEVFASTGNEVLEVTKQGS